VDENHNSAVATDDTSERSLAIPPTIDPGNVDEYPPASDSTPAVFRVTDGARAASFRPA
jgi:hypothetical protein